MVDISTAATLAALTREESRGGHTATISQVKSKNGAKF